MMKRARKTVMHEIIRPSTVRDSTSSADKVHPTWTKSDESSPRHSSLLIRDQTSASLIAEFYVVLPEKVSELI